jgi:stromal membrane-associated protein
MDPKKRVAIAAQRPENQCCADCGCKLLTSSIWASSTLGIFICINCSGRHRNLGTHITFVRSVGLDSWTEDQATIMESIGNQVSNEYWEANMPKDYKRPATEDLDGLTKFIRLKYELGKWADKSRKPPHVLLQEGKKPAAKKSKAAKLSQSKSTTTVSANEPPAPVQRSNSTNLLDFGAPAPTLQQSNSVDMLFGAAPAAPVAAAPISNSASFGLSYSSTPKAQPAAQSFGFGQPAAQPAAQPAFGFNQPAARPAAQPAFGFGQPTAQPAFGFGQPAARPAAQPAFGFGQPAAQQSFDPFAQQAAQPRPADARNELKSMLASSSNHPAPATSTGVFRQNSPARAAFGGQQQPIRGGGPHGPRPKNDAFSGISPF